MNSNLRPITESHISPVLVLGNPCISRRISDDLESLGFRAFLETDFPDLPKTGVNSDIQSMREFLLKLHQKKPDILIHPGNSEWSDRPEFYSLADEIGLSTLSASLKAIHLFSNRMSFLSFAESLGVPNLTLSLEPVQSVREVERVLSETPQKTKGPVFPIVVKSAIKRGEGLGIQVFQTADDLRSGLGVWLEQLRRNVGEAILVIEHYLEGSRQIELPFVRFADGKVKFFQPVDGSLQSRHRKMMEVCPAESVGEETLHQMHQWTELILQKCHFVGMGSIEFLVDGTRAYLIDGYAKLGANYPLWEKADGTSAVAWQVDSYFHQKYQEQLPVKEKWNNGIFLRVYAEDSLLGVPQPGVIQQFHLYENQDQSRFSEVEVSLPLTKNQEVDFRSSGFLGVISVSAKGVSQCLKTASSVLSQTYIHGGLQTNLRFLKELVSHSWVREGMFHAGFIEEDFIPIFSPPLATIQSFMAVTNKLKEKVHSEKSDVWLVGNQKLNLKTEVKWVEKPEYWITNSECGFTGAIQHANSSERIPVCVYPIQKGVWRAHIGEWSRVIRKVQAQSSLKLYSQVKGRVHALFYQKGKVAEMHTPIILIESLKTLVPHQLPIRVRIKDWKVKAEAIVNYGDVLAELEKVKE